MIGIARRVAFQSSELVFLEALFPQSLRSVLLMSQITAPNGNIWVAGTPWSLHWLLHCVNSGG